ncbi:MAG: DUF1801 domain-containing protein [Bacteroidetes bacterium]|nr:DUF1801 domain-containing protein [Bacteroidota bacterium]
MAKAVKKAAKKAVKKAAPKKAAASKSETGIKYSDKSIGQPELVPIFESIVTLLKPYAKGDMKLRGGKAGQAILVNEKKVVIDGREKTEMWFAGVLVQKGYVGFYLIPAYDKAFQPLVHPDLLKCLKGKSCFHIKKLDKELLGHMATALKAGHRDMKQKGWI